MELKDLIKDSATGDMSHTKLWANIAYASGTAAFLYAAVKGTASGDIWLIYLGVVGASATASKFLSLKFSK